MLLHLLEQDWHKSSSNVPEVPEEEKEIIYEYIVSQSQHRSLKKYRLWPRIAGIAAAVVFIVSGIYFFKYRNNQAITTQPENTASLIKPGRNAATLTLANGKKIVLSNTVNGELAKEAGVSITKTANGQVVYNITGTANAGDGAINPNRMNTLSTAKGETYMLILPDKSKVWLNAASSLSYAASLIDRGKRTVTLRGEGYFEIFKDKTHPFVVKTDKQEVEVLGTHFNINSYTDESFVTTTLLEGSVRVTSGGQNQMLNPGQQVLNNGTIFQVRQANVEEATAWKDGDFQFNDEKMSNIVKKLERWYDVEIELSDKFANKEFSGNISRSRSISRVLLMIEKTNGIHFKIEGRRVTAIEK